MLIPSTITARRTRKYTSTLYIHRTIRRVDYDPMNGGGRSNLQPPNVSDYPPARPTLPPPFTLVIAIRRMPRAAIYTDDGVPTCMGMVPMEYVQSDPTKAHLYRCRAEGCHLADSKTGGIRHCDTEVWEDPTRNIRWFGESVRRAARHGESCTVNDKPLSGSSSL